MYEIEGALGPSVIRFVETHVNSLLTWDILVYFYRNPDVRIDAVTLADRLGRRTEEVVPEVAALCDAEVLALEDSVISYRPAPALQPQLTGFIEACQDRGRRLALIALVLQRIGRPQGE